VTGPAGRTLELQQSHDLLNWTTWTNVVGAGETVTVPLPDPKAGSPRFFRAVIR
jgi:hypothetical protein